DINADAAIYAATYAGIAARAAANATARDLTTVVDTAAAAAARAAGYRDPGRRISGAADAILKDIAQVQGPSTRRPSWIARQLRRAGAEKDAVFLLTQPLWLEEVPAEAAQLWTQLQRDLRGLAAGFEVWIDWYQDRLDGKPLDWEIERQWALVSKEQ